MLLFSGIDRRASIVSIDRLSTSFGASSAIAVVEFALPLSLSPESALPTVLCSLARSATKLGLGSVGLTTVTFFLNPHLLNLCGSVS